MKISGRIKIHVLCNILVTFVLSAAAAHAADSSDVYVMGEGFHISHWGAEKDPVTFDVQLFRSINSNRSTFKDKFLPTVNSMFMPLNVLLPVGMMVYGAATKRYYDENTGFLLATAEATNYILTFGIKSFSSRLRPYLALRNVYYRVIAAESLFSFPSGHASFTFCNATMFALRYPTQPYIYVPLYMFALTICYERPYFGLHYPVDLIGGAVIGTLSSILIYSLRPAILNFYQGSGYRDSNDDAKTAGFTAGAFLLSDAANKFLAPALKHSNQKLNIGFSPCMTNTGSGIGINVGW